MTDNNGPPKPPGEPPRPTPPPPPEPAQPQPQAPPRQMDGVPPWEGKLALRKPVHANGELVNEIVFREPTGADIERIGFPLHSNMQIDAMVMGQMMAHLAGVPPSTIKALHPKDWTNGAFSIWRFFIPDLP